MNERRGFTPSGKLRQQDYALAYDHVQPDNRLQRRRGAPPLNRSVVRPRESVIEKTQCKLREAEFFFTQLSRAAEQVADA